MAEVVSFARKQDLNDGPCSSSSRKRMALTTIIQPLRATTPTRMSTFVDRRVPVTSVQATPLNKNKRAAPTTVTRSATRPARRRAGVIYSAQTLAWNRA
jgi:hypothetical protein